MTTLNRWSDDEVTLALMLYLSQPFGKLRSTNPDVVRLAALLGRSPGAVSFKLGNLGFCDNTLRERGVKGLSNVSQGAGGYTASVAVYNPGGDLYLTRNERRALGIGGARIGSVSPVIDGRYGSNAGDAP